MEQDLLDEIKSANEDMAMVQTFIDDWPKYYNEKQKDMKQAEKVVKRMLIKKRVDEFDKIMCASHYRELEVMEELHKEDFEKIEKLKKRIELCQSAIEKLKDVILIAKEIEETYIVL